MEKGLLLYTMQWNQYMPIYRGCQGTERLAEMFYNHGLPSLRQRQTSLRVQGLLAIIR